LSNLNLLISEVKYIVITVLLVLYATLFGLAEEEGRKAIFKHKLAVDFGECPDGHKKLVNVPIVYGLVGPLHKRPEEYDAADKELSEKRNKGEVVFGGDILYEHSPKLKVVCDQCGFRYHPSNLPIDFPDLAFWAKDSKKAADFRFKFSERLLDFPRLKASEASVNYSQTLAPDGKRLIFESISYQTTVPIEEVLKIVQQWLRDAELDSADLKRIENAYAHHTYSYNKDGISISVIDDTYWSPGKIYVHLSLIKER
jgi:hypothetical protein